MTINGMRADRVVLDEISAAVREELTLLTPDQVCELLQVNKEWLYDEVQAGRIEHVRLGRRTLRFKPDQVKRYVYGETPVRGAVSVTEVPRRRGRPRKA